MNRNIWQVMLLLLACMLSGNQVLADRLIAWGPDEYGLLDVPDGDDFIAIAAGRDYSLALRSNGTLIAWGDDYHGQLDVPDGNDFIAIAVGRYHSLALRSNGTLVSWGCWGWYDEGQCYVPDSNDFVAIAAGGSHSLALRSNGTLVAWGDNSYGQCNLPTGNDFVGIAAGDTHNLALRLDGTLAAWGDNNYKQCNVPDGNDFVAIAAGERFSIALRSKGTLEAWGWNYHGQCNIPDGTDFVTIAAGEDHALALRSDGTLTAWGWDYNGQCDVPLGNDFTGICGGFSHSVATYRGRATGILYVDQNATGTGDGSSWSSAYIHLQDALAAARYGDEIRVAQGTYRSDQGMNQTPGDSRATFQLRDGVAVKGGYAGSTEQDPAVRDVQQYETILSGYLDRDRNALHVVTAGSNTDTNTILDGFTITGGVADWGLDDMEGGGLLIHGNTTIINCTFAYNQARYGGGAIAHDGENTRIINCIFINNSSFGTIIWPGAHGLYPIGQGGALLFSSGNAMVVNCLFAANYANKGGAVYITYGKHTFENCTFVDNIAIPINYMYRDIPSTSFGAVGGLYIDSYSNPDVTVTNSIFWNNLESSGLDESSQIHVTNDYQPVLNYSCIQGWTGKIFGEGNLDFTPLLTPYGHLRFGSPCIDSGNPDFIVDINALNDIDEESRVIGSTIDIGADEFLDSDNDGLPDWWEIKHFNSPTAAAPYDDSDADYLININEYELYNSNPVAPPIYVDQSSGSLRTIQEGINLATDGDTVLVASGIYTGHGNYNLDYGSKSITLLAPYGATIDCGNSGRTVNFETIKGTFGVLEGFVITGGSGDLGGGLRIENSRFMLKDCILGDNSAEKAGGIYCFLSAPTINNLSIRGNTADVNEPNAGLIKSSSISLRGDLSLEAGRLDIYSSWFDGTACINLIQGTLLKITGEPGDKATVIRTNVKGIGDIEIDAGEQLIIEGGAVVNLGGHSDCNPDPNSGGCITVNGSLVVQGNAILESTNVDVKLLDVNDPNIIQYNNITLREASTGFGGEFFVSGPVVIRCNNIKSQGDRYLDLDPDSSIPEEERPKITDNRVTVIINEGTLESRGTVLELRAADYDYGGPDNPYRGSGAYEVDPNSLGFTDDPSKNWVLEKLILEGNAKLNLTNRQGFEFQDFSDPNIDPNILTDIETVYVKELVMGPNSVLNSAFQTLYYQNLIEPNGTELIRDLNNPFAPLANGSRFEDVPLLGFSLGIIAMDDTAPSPHNEFDIRVRTRIFDPNDEQPNPPEPPKEGSLERIDYDPDVQIPLGSGGVMDMRTQASGKQSASSVAAKGAFARAGDEDITIEFEYLFLKNPEAEIIIYLSDDPKVNRKRRAVARIRPPAPGRPGSIGSDQFAVFSGTFSPGGFNFVRGTYIELELRGENARCWIDNWDPLVNCFYECGDYDNRGIMQGGIEGINLYDFLVLLGEVGMSPVDAEKGCLDLVRDGCVNTDDLIAWGIDSVFHRCSEWIHDNPVSETVMMSNDWPTILGYDSRGTNKTAPLIIIGKPARCVDLGQEPQSYLYSIDVNGLCVGDGIEPVHPDSDNIRGYGRIVTDSNGGIYAINGNSGIVRQDPPEVVLKTGYDESNMVLVGFKDDKGKLLLDAAFDPNNRNIVYVVPVQVHPPETNSYEAAAKLKLTGEGKYEVQDLYGPNPVTDPCQSIALVDNENCRDIVYEPDLQHLHEIEIDFDNNLFVLNSCWTSKNNRLLIKNTRKGNDPGILVRLNDYVPELVGPTAMVASSFKNMLYIASSVVSPSDPNGLTIRIYRFLIIKNSDKTVKGIEYTSFVDIHGPEPGICKNHQDLCNLGYISAITSMTEDPKTGDLYVTGFTAPKFPANEVLDPELIKNHGICTTPMLAVISPNDSSVNAYEITGSDLVLPISLVWIQAEPIGSNITVNITPDMKKLYMLASYWLDSGYAPSY